MRALITGSQGFVGRHLIREMQNHSWEIAAFDLLPADQQFSKADDSPSSAATDFGAVPQRLDQAPQDRGLHFQGDIRDKLAVEKVVQQTQPDACIHLSGLAFVPEGWTNTEELFSINVIGTIHLLEACRQYRPDAKILAISSAEVYGPQSAGRSVSEKDALAPDNPYAISKTAADHITRLYAQQYDMHTLVARPSNHIGPGQSPHFAIASFAAQLADIAAGKKEAVIKVGNLDNIRNFTDVRDVARAYRLLIEKGKPGEAYNIASEREVTLRSILEILCAISGTHPAVEIDPKRLRPNEPRPRLDTSKITKEANWKPEIDLGTTLRDIMNEARLSRVS